jgi:tRNA(His) guanylyltransferase
MFSFSRAHAFTKPNDVNALNLMNIAAKSVMKELSSDIVLAYGDSDEYRYSFLITL